MIMSSPTTTDVRADLWKQQQAKKGRRNGSVLRSSSAPRAELHEFIADEAHERTARPCLVLLLIGLRTRLGLWSCFFYSPHLDSDLNIKRSLYFIILRCLGRIWLGWVSCSLLPICKINPNSRKKTCWGRKKWLKMPLFNLSFLGLGWPWVLGSTSVSQ